MHRRLFTLCTVMGYVGMGILLPTLAFEPLNLALVGYLIVMFTGFTVMVLCVRELMRMIDEIDRKKNPKTIFDLADEPTPNAESPKGLTLEQALEQHEKNRKQHYKQ
jgi:hypothetical protein